MRHSISLHEKKVSQTAAGYLARINTTLLNAVLLLVMLCAGITTVAQEVNERQVKASYIYNFSKFVEWPVQSFKDTAAPFIIGLLGPDPFGPFLQQTVREEYVSGHPIVVKYYDSIGALDHCHILFINLHDQIKESIEAAGSKNILTVGEAPDFTASGGMIQFFSDKDTVRLEINPAAVKAEGLTISSKLLRVAKIYE